MLFGNIMDYLAVGTLLEKVHHWGHPIFCSCFLLAFEDLSSQLHVPVTTPAIHCHVSLPWWTYSSGTNRLSKSFLLLVTLATVLEHDDRKVIQCIDFHSWKTKNCREKISGNHGKGRQICGSGSVSPIHKHICKVRKKLTLQVGRWTCTKK